jgi:pimeloyl-ACP methyl ester carboxylesterase
MKKIIFSHGFGVKADARGMFTDVAAAFPEYNSVMFDYNGVLPNGDTIVASLPKQSEKLQSIINDVEADEIILIAHSQGSIIAGLVSLSKVSKVILLAPPVTSSMQRVIDKIAKRPGAEFNREGTSKLPRTDGTTTLLSKEYIESLDSVNPLELYQKIANDKPTTIIRATEDQVLGMTNVDEVGAATLIDIPADHDFTGDSRHELIEVLQKVLA